MHLAGKPGQELTSKVVRLLEYYKTIKAGIPQSTKLVSIIISAHTPKWQR